MEFSPRAAELTTLLESRMTNFYTNFQVDEIGRVVSVGDGIARVYGLNEIQAGEMVEFASGVKGIALNLENENVGYFFLDKAYDSVDRLFVIHVMERMGFCRKWCDWIWECISTSSFSVLVNGLPISHVVFADDSMFFLRASRNNARSARKLISKFSTQAGLREFGKSLECEEGVIPVKYWRTSSLLG